MMRILQEGFRVFLFLFPDDSGVSWFTDRTLYAKMVFSGTELPLRCIPW